MNFKFKSIHNNKCRLYLGSRTEKVCLHLLPPIAGGITENNTNARKKEIQNVLVQEKVMFWEGCHIIQESYLICINQLHILCCLFQNFPVQVIIVLSKDNSSIQSGLSLQLITELLQGKVQMKELKDADHFHFLL